MKAAKIFLGLLVICASAMGLLVEFEILTSDQGLHYGGVMAGGLVILSAASFVLSSMGGEKKTEPPPRL
jgi:hypothetical protein